MTVSTQTPTSAELLRVIAEMRTWQDDAHAVALHPGDLGWNWQFGAETLASSARVWHIEGAPFVLALLDDDNAAPVLRMSVAPWARADAELMGHVADTLDLGGPMLPTGDALVEARGVPVLAKALAARGWSLDAPWTPLVLDLHDPVEHDAMEIREVGGSDDRLVADRVAVHRGSFDASTFTSQRWLTMVRGPLHDDARSLIGYDESGAPVAMVTVWSAGANRPGLIEPMGVHRDHRGNGFGKTITRAGAAALRELGASHAMVCTPTDNAGGIAAYLAAGFTQLPASHDLRRGASESS